MKDAKTLKREREWADAGNSDYERARRHESVDANAHKDEAWYREQNRLSWKNKWTDWKADNGY